MNLTIAQMREIVAGAPEGQDTYCCDSGGYFKQLPIMKSCSHCLDLDTIRKSTDQHYYGRSEAEELAAYAELSQEKIEGGAMLVGDFSEAKKKIQSTFEDDRTDYVSDIRNHIAPTTRVIEG